MTFRTLFRVPAVALAMLLFAGAAHAQSADQILQQMQQLQAQMQGASDPCPYMPRFKQLLNQLASSNPDMYNAVKPMLDVMNGDNDGCSTSTAPAAPAPPPPPPPAPEPVRQPPAVPVRPYPSPATTTTQVTAATPVTASQAAAIQAERDRLKQGAQLCPSSGTLTGTGTQHGDVAIMTPVPCTPGGYFIVRGNTATNINSIPIYLRTTVAPPAATPPSHTIGTPTKPTTTASKPVAPGKPGVATKPISNKPGATIQTANAPGIAMPTSGSRQPAAGCYAVMHPGEDPVPVDCCRDLSMMVQVDAHWFDKKKTEVVAYMTNNSMSDLTCTTAFLEPDGSWGEMGTGLLKFGATHQGGQFGGLWSMSAKSPVLGYKCFEGKDPMTPSGNFCNANITFPPYATTDTK